MSNVVGRHGATVVVMAVGATVTIVGSLLPWVRTGSRTRHSYDVFALADRLGFAPGGWAATGLRWWPFVPLLTITAVVSAWWGWRRPGGVVGVFAGLYAGGIGMAVTAAPDVVDIGIGAPVTAAGGVILLLAAIATGIVSPPGRTAPTAPAG